MTTDRDFDRLARAWLETGPDEAPDRVIAAVLQAAEATPQVRRGLRWPIRRSFAMNRLSLAAGLVAILAVSSAEVCSSAARTTRSAWAGGGGGQRDRLSAPAPMVGVPDRRRRRVRVPHRSSRRRRQVRRQRPSSDRSRPSSSRLDRPATDDPGSPAGLPLSLRVEAGHVPLPVRQLGDGQLPAAATIADGNGLLQLTSTDTPGGCTVGDVGKYAWTGSAGGTRLTVTLVSDDCAARRSALPGDWQRVGCKDTTDGCFGDLVEAGTYPSQYFRPRLVDSGSWQPQWGALTYTVPAGWANSADWPNSFILTPSDAYALRGPMDPPKGRSGRSATTDCPWRSARTRRVSARPSPKVRPPSMVSSATCRASRASWRARRRPSPSTATRARGSTSRSHRRGRRRARTSLVASRSRCC